MNRIKRLVSITLIIFLFVGRVGVYSVLASETQPPAEKTPVEETTTEETGDTTKVEETVEPSPSPAEEEPGIDIENEAVVINDIDSTAETGDNEIVEITPTPTPETTEEGEEEVVEETQDACDLESEADCAEETQGVEEEGAGVADEIGEAVEEEGQELTQDQGGETSGEEGAVEIETGDAVSVTQVENSVNTTEVGSEILYQTLNIFVPGDIDLSVSPLAIAETVFGENENNEPVVNVAVLDVNNITYLSNDIVSFANTGDNQAGGISEAIITTGDAYSVVSLLNEVNTTIVDSTIHIVTINIFGNVEGNILLPELSLDSGVDCCGETVQIGNTATVENNVGSSAVSGENIITTTNTEIVSITTGEANSVVNIVNIVNKSLIGTVFHYLHISSLGTWVGDFLGWDGFEALEGGGSLALSSTGNEGNGSDCPGCVGDVSIENGAYVTNNISSMANTGGNSINGDGGSINTGNAYSSVSIINLINSSIINSTGFFGFINIFGFFEGDIGGASLFEVEEKEVIEIEPEIVEENTENAEPGSTVHEAGGELEIYQYNNVGTHVLPGDTVTFFITVRNPGTGRVYGAVLDLGLIKDGVNVGGGLFELGDIESGKGIKITTGMVLSEDAEPGDYMAHAEVGGYVGPDNDLISAYSDSFFKIVGYSPLPLMPGIVEEVQAVEPKKEVLGTSSPEGMSKEEMFKFFLFGLTGLYVPSKSLQKRKEIAEAVVKGGKKIGMLMTSFFA